MSSNRIRRNGPTRRQAKKTSPNYSSLTTRRINVRPTINSFKTGGTNRVNRIAQRTNLRPSRSANFESHGMPDELYVNLAWSVGTNLQLTSAQGAFVFEGNNPWDPDPQLGGTSAQEYQQLMLLYRYCVVYGSAINVNYTCINGSTFSVASVPRTTNPGMTYDVVKSLPRCVLGPSVVNTGVSTANIYNECNTAALFGLPDLDYDSVNHDFDLDNGESGTAVTEPLRKWYWITYFATAATQSGFNGSAEFQIVYRCKFFGKRYLSSLQDVTSDGDDGVVVQLSRTTKNFVDPPP